MLSLYTAEEADEVAYMPNWILGSSWKFPHACYRDAALLPFEGIRIPVPVLYDTAARIQFGDYEIPFRAGGGHNYPYFRPQEELLVNAFEENPIPFQYRFSADDLRRNIPADSITASV